MSGFVKYLFVKCLFVILFFSSLTFTYVVFTPVVFAQAPSSNAPSEMRSLLADNPSTNLTAENSKIIETNDITTILPHLDKNTLVVFAVDYTLFWSKTRLGSPEWRKYLIQNDMKLGLSREESIKKYYPMWIKAQQFSEVALLDNRLPKMIKDLKHKALGYIALTSRQGSSAEVTRWQFHKFDIDFTRSPFAACHYHSKFKYPAVFRDGVLFAHSFNDKGQVFWEWMIQAMPQLSSMRSVHKVVCVDDDLENLQTLQKVVQSLNLEFVGVRYSAGDALKKPVFPALVESERQILMTNYSDSEARLLLESIGSYAED